MEAPLRCRRITSTQLVLQRHRAIVESKRQQPPCCPRRFDAASANEVSDAVISDCGAVSEFTSIALHVGLMKCWGAGVCFWHGKQDHVDHVVQQHRFS